MLHFQRTNPRLKTHCTIVSQNSHCSVTSFLVLHRERSKNISYSWRSHTGKFKYLFSSQTTSGFIFSNKEVKLATTWEQVLHNVWRSCPCLCVFPKYTFWSRTNKFWYSSHSRAMSQRCLWEEKRAKTNWRQAQ